MKYKISQYAKKYNVTIRTVWNWIYSNKLQTERTSTNRILIIEDESKNINDAVAIYARVSSSENKSNLTKAVDNISFDESENDYEYREQLRNIARENNQ